MEVIRRTQFIPSCQGRSKLIHFNIFVQAVAIVSVFFLITAILVFCLKTHPGLRIAEIMTIGNLSREARSADGCGEVRSSGGYSKFRPAPVTVDKTNSKAHPGFMVPFLLKF